MKIANFWREIVSFFQLFEKQSVSSITLPCFSTFYSFLLPFFVLEIFKFKHDKFFVRHSASICISSLGLGLIEKLLKKLQNLPLEYWYNSWKTFTKKFTLAKFQTCIGNWHLLVVFFNNFCSLNIHNTFSWLLLIIYNSSLIFISPFLKSFNQKYRRCKSVVQS